MTKPFPALCVGCNFSVPEVTSSWILRCTHPLVNAKDSWALSSSKINGSECRAERERTSWFAACGRSGKLWQPLTQ
jgi:hypothetical protein